MSFSEWLFPFCARQIIVYPLGDERSTKSLSMYLHMHCSKEVAPDSGTMIELSLSILDQQVGKKHITHQGYSALHDHVYQLAS
jgi:hypothetical protein